VLFSLLMCLLAPRRTFRLTTLVGPLFLLPLVALACGGSSRASEQRAAMGGAGGGPAGGMSGALGAGAGGVPTAGAGGKPPQVENPFPCENPSPVADASSGFVRCDNGYVYREKVGICPVIPRTEPEPGFDPTLDECEYDADCSDDPQGYCRSGFCAHGCVSDAECNSSSICSCDDDRGLGDCVSAECKSDADCTPGLHCALVVSGRSDAAIWIYACQQAGDECAADADCPPAPGSASGDCELAESGRYCREP